MFFLRIIFMSLRSLFIHPMRSILATLGVIIGVAGVVAAMSIVEGMKSRFNEGFSTIGANNFFIFPGQQRRQSRSVAIETLKLEDCEAIRHECDKVKNASPQILSGGLIKFLSKNTNASIMGTDEQFSEINNYEPEQGRFIDKSDIVGSAAVCVLGFKVKQELFGGLPAVGATVKINSIIGGTKGFNVVGVMEEKGNIGFTDADNQVIIPITTAMTKVYGLKSISLIVAEAKSPSEADIEAAKDQVKQLLRRRHRIRPGTGDDFTVQAQREILQQVGSFTDIIFIVLFSISVISLLVGAIGIMNIMLVAVTERTREIGVRMAMGAQRWDVLQQFLIEASVVSFCGGAIGVLVGWGMGRLIEQITRIFSTVTTPMAVAFALAMATFTGLVSGIYPAYRASRLDPVEALRYE